MPTSTPNSDNNNTQKEDEAAGKSQTPQKRPRVSEQTKRDLKSKLTTMGENVGVCTHVLNLLQVKPHLWKRDEFKDIREAVEVIKSRPADFPSIMGDAMPDGSTVSHQTENGGKTPALTANYIRSIAHYKDLNFDVNPTLQVVSAELKNENQTTKERKTITSNVTHLRLCDGSKDVVVGRLPIHRSQDGLSLRGGDIIQLDRFTPLTYPASGRDNPQRSPGIVIHTYRKVGYTALPDKLNDPEHCVSMTAEEMEDYNNRETQCRDEAAGTLSPTEDFEELVEVECTPEHRYCSVYGVSTVVCVCQSDPVANIDLEVVCWYCHFATKKVCNMNNSEKRNMLYWWYMTNVYNICGKGNREDPPACLKAAIRMAYPSKDGFYKIFQRKK